MMTWRHMIWLILPCCLACGGAQRTKGGLTPLDGVALAEVDSALAPKRLALVVGINAFEDERWPDLHHAAADARDLGALLADPDRGRFDEVQVLADPAGVDRARIERALSQLEQDNTAEDDTVLIYFSTHGTLSRGAKGSMQRYLVATDTDQDHIQTSALGVADLMRRFDALPSQRKVLILASCHSGAGKSALPGAVRDELKGIKGAFFVKPLAETSRASMVLTACGWGETAREDDRLAHDIYTHFLLEALADGDTDGDGAVTATEAHAQAMARTYYYSQGRQRPQVESRVSGADPIVLSGHRLRPGEPVVFSFLPRLTGLQVLVDGRSKGSLPGRLVMEPGSHRVVVCEPDSCGSREAPLLDTEVDLQPGEELAVESLLAEQRRDWLVSIRTGYQRFLDPTIRAEFIAPLSITSISLTRQHFPLDWMETAIDLSLAGAGQTMRAGGDLVVHQDLLQISYGLLMLVRLDLGAVQILAGPRLAGIHNLRLHVNPDGSSQHVANFSPGLVAGLRYQFEFGLALEAQARVHYLSIATQDDALSTGVLDLFAGLGWNF